MRRFFMSVFVLALVCSPTLVWAALGYEEGIDELTKSIVTDAAKFQKQKLAVVDFTDLAGNVTELGRFLAEELSVSLVLTGKGLEMVDRTQLNRIFQEQALSFSGALDPTAVRKVGQIAGVDALIAGTITDLGDTVRLTLKIMATNTGRLISAARTTIPKTGTISMLMEREVAVPRMPSAVGSGASARPSPLPTRRLQETSSVSFQNSFLRVTPKSISKSKDKKRINIVLQFENISKRDVYLCIRSGYKRLKAGLTDNEGNFIILSKLNGLSTTNENYSYKDLKGTYTVITQNSSYTVVMLFESENEIGGSAFSFSADFFRYVIDDEKSKKGHPEQFSVGIANIKLH